MKKYHPFVVFLLILALPYCAAATMAEGPRCQHENLSVLTEAGAMTHHNHDAMSHAHHAGAQASNACDCADSCVCASHCTGGGGSAVLPLNLGGFEAPANVDQIDAAYRGFRSDPQRIPLFRPPIATLPSAA